MSHFSLGHRNDGEPSNWTIRMPQLSLPDSWRQLSTARLIALGLAVVVAALAFCVGLLHTSLFAIQRIDVNGLSHLDRAQVLDLAKVKTGEAMISFDEAKAARQLEANPWVETADVRSAWPHVVTIAVTERKAIAQAQTANKQWATIGTSGIVLATSATPAKNLPALLDVVAPTRVGAGLDVSTHDLTNIAQIMPASLAAHVRQVQNQAGTLRLGLDTGTIVVLGDATDLANKLTAAASVVSHSDAKKLAILDVRSPHLPIATPVGAATPSKTSASATSTTVAKGKTKSSTTSTTVKKVTTTSTSVYVGGTN